MEDVLRNLRRNEDKEKSSAAIQLLKVYINNVVRNPSNIKYRKIRISNAKFHSVIWSVEDARLFLFLAGFEENGDFLVLPEEASPNEAWVILDNIASGLDDDGSSSSENKTPQRLLDMQAATSSNLLKLRKSTDSSMFDEVVKADMTLLSYMKEMGFEVSVAEKALIITKNKGIQPAMDWINSNPTKVDEVRMAGFKEINESSKLPDCESEHPPHVEQQITEDGPVSRYQATLDERHKFQEKQRLEAIEAARLEKAEQKRQKEYLLKNLEDKKRERREKGEQIKCMRMCDGTVTTTTAGAGETSDQSTHGEESISLKLRLPDGKVATMKTQSQSPLGSIYNYIASISSLKVEDFKVMTISPQRKLTEMEKSIGELGLRSQETLIIQRVDQLQS